MATSARLQSFIRRSEVRGIVASLLCMCLAVASIARPGSDVASFRLELPAELRFAQDIRWVTDSAVMISAGRAGVFELPLTGSPAPRRVLRGGDPKGFFFCSRLGVGSQYFVTAAPLFAVAFVRTADARIDQLSFSATVDIDAKGDRVAILGAQRDGRGTWSSDGAIAWTGSLADKGKNLRILLRSQAGPGARTMALCHFLEMGAIRFMPDGSLVVVPGVDPGVYVFDSQGRLRETWDTAPLGFSDRCSLSLREFQLLARSGVSRAQWINGHEIIDDVIALPEGPGLILRRWKSGHVTWRLIRLRPSAKARSDDLPFQSTSPDTHLRADVRGHRLAVLFFEFEEIPGSKPARPNEIIVQDLPR